MGEFIQGKKTSLAHDYAKRKRIFEMTGHQPEYPRNVRRMDGKFTICHYRLNQGNA
jgi:hypothetical protein